MPGIDKLAGHGFFILRNLYILFILSKQIIYVTINVTKTNYLMVKMGFPRNIKFKKERR